MTAATLLPVPADQTCLVDTARALVAWDKGLLAIDESISTCNKRFAALGIAQDEPTRRAYRDMIITTAGLGESVSGVILFDETIRQRTRGDVPFSVVLTHAGIIPGIKIDLGAKPMAGHPGERVTEGLDGLRQRLQWYSRMGARLAKWRAVFAIGDSTPSHACVEANAHALARYAALCQEAGLVPIVEPEVLMAGDHTLARCGQVTEQVLREVFTQLHSQGVLPEGMIVKPNMVLPGSGCPDQESDQAVADATISCLRRAVPAAVAGIAFLSGGQSGDLATARLNAINADPGGLPWPVGFSFGRAIQQPALSIWDGHDANTERAQHALLRRAENNQAARHCPPSNTGPRTSSTVPRHPGLTDHFE